MYTSYPDFFSVRYCHLRQYFIQNVKSIFSSADFAQILKYTPKDVQRISFGSEDFSVISTDLICQGFSQLPVNVNSLNFNNNSLITSRSGDELAQIFKAFPAGIKSLSLDNVGNKSANDLIVMFQALPTKLRILSLYMNRLEQNTEEEIVTIFRSFPKGLRSLSIERMNFSNRSYLELTKVFESLPRSLFSLELHRFSFNHLEEMQDNQGSSLLALPRTLSHLSLRGSNLGSLPTETIIKMFEDFPDTLISLNLSCSGLEKKTILELITIIAAIPHHVKQLSLTLNNIEKRPPNEIKQLYQAIEAHVGLLYLEHEKAPISLNDQLNPLKQSKRAIMEQVQKNIFPTLTTEEKKNEFGYLIALERAQRVLWRKNPQAFRDDFNNFDSNLQEQGFEQPDEPSKVVNFSMAYAIKGIAQANNLDEITRQLFRGVDHDANITPRNKIFLKASNKFKIACLWTAFVLIGSLIKDKKISHSNIMTLVFDGSTFNTSGELGLFSLFSANSFYHTTFKALLNKDMIHKYLMLAATPLQNEEFLDEIIDSLALESEEYVQPIMQDGPIIAPSIPAPQITANLLYQLAKDGNLAEIKKYTVSADIITQQLSYFTATFYNALMVATVYRHFDVVRYFIEEKQADCSIEVVRWNDSLNLIDCAKVNWWFIPAASEAFIQYIEDACSKYKQKLLAYQFIEHANSTLNAKSTREQVATLMSTADTESVCVTVAKAYEQTSSTQEILTLLSEAVVLKDRVAAIDLGQRYQDNPTSSDANAAFDAYLKAAQLGEEEALIPLERLAQRASAAQKLELSSLYETFFHDDEKASYWRTKSTELSNSALTM